MSSMKPGEQLPILTLLEVRDMLFASTIRSTVAYAKEFSVQRSQLPFGYRMILPEDMVKDGMSLEFSDGIPLFATDTIRYRGEPLGLIVGPDPVLCDNLSLNVKVAYRESEPNFSWTTFPSSRIAARKRIRIGKTEVSTPKGISDQQWETTTHWTGSFDHEYSEPSSALAVWEYDKLVIYCASQWPNHVRSSISEVLKVPQKDILIRPTDLGQSIEGRIWFPSLIACHAACAARLCNKPVKILYTRGEDYCFAPKQARSCISISSLSDQQGRLASLDIRLVINIGAYNPLAEELLDHAVLSLLGIYACPVVSIDAFAVQSNVIPLGALGNLGSIHGFFALDAHLNHLARKCQKSPAEIKAINMIAKGMTVHGDVQVSSVIPFSKIQQKLEIMADFQRKHASYEVIRKRDPASRKGIIRGIAGSFGYLTGDAFLNIPEKNRYSVEVQLEKDLTIVIKTEAAISSENARLMWKKTVSEILSLPERSIHVIQESVHSNSRCGPMVVSRGVFAINKLIERSCRALQKKRFRETLPLTVKSQMQCNPSIQWTEDGLSGKAFDAASWCGTIIELEVDAITGQVKPLTIWMAVDAGRIINKPVAESSLRAQAVNALRLCLLDDVVPETLDSSSYLAKKRLPFNEIPDIVIEFMDSDRTSALGIGELPFATIPSAYYGALSQALGLNLPSIPASPHDVMRIWEAT